MSSPNKKEWKNPNDVMRIHRIKRQSSSGLTRSHSASNMITRRKSLTSITSNNENTQKFSLFSSKSDCAISSQHREQLALKRINPFSCDTMAPGSKRRSILDTNLTSPDAPDMEKDIMNSSGDAAFFNTEISDGHEEKAQTNKLFHVLTIAEEMLQVDNISTESAESFQTQLPTNIIQQKTSPIPPNVLKERMASTNNTIVEDKCSEAKQIHPHPPVDWSLKTKLRIVAHSNLESFSKVPGIDAKHVDSFVHHRLDNDSSWKELDVYQKIKRCCMHYSYPQMPWMSTFPRSSSDFKSRSTSLFAIHEDVIAALHKDWMNAFTSVYQQLRGGLCPYFYICTHQFTVLFRCQRTSVGASMSALLSPSTRGFREMITKEGIDFRMPHIRMIKTDPSKKFNKGNKDHWGDEGENVSPTPCTPLNRTKATTGDTCIDDLQQDEGNDKTPEEISFKDKTEENIEVNNGDESDDDIDDHDGASKWLQGMGFDKKDFPSLQPFKVKLQREGYREIDNRPQSMIYVEGVDVHPFFNLLLNYSSCIASSGPQHGIPPTILSPVTFVGGTLVTNTMKHSIIRDEFKHGDIQSKTSHVFEVAGPLLPHHTLNIASVLQSSPEVSRSTISYSTHHPSAALNSQTVNQEDKDKLASGLNKLFVDISQANPGLIADLNERLALPTVLENGTAIKELNILQKGFTWSS